MVDSRGGEREKDTISITAGVYSFSLCFFITSSSQAPPASRWSTLGTRTLRSRRTLDPGALEIMRKDGAGVMARLKYKDFNFRPSLHGNRGKVRAIPQTRDTFLKTIDIYISKNNRKIINVETQEDFFRVWYIE